MQCLISCSLHAPAGRRPSLAPPGGGACHQWSSCRNAERHGEPACEEASDCNFEGAPSRHECDPLTMRIALLLALVAALCGCVGCEAPADPPWTLEHELGLLSTETARLLSVPCSSYAHTFRRDRYSATELLAAVRVARIQACSQGASTECGSPAEALDDASDWDNLVERLQARGLMRVVLASRPAFSGAHTPAGAVWLLCQAALHALCQHAAIQASVGDNMARSAAVKLVNTAVRSQTVPSHSQHRQALSLTLSGFDGA